MQENWEFLDFGWENIDLSINVGREDLGDYKIVVNFEGALNKCMSISLLNLSTCYVNASLKFENSVLVQRLIIMTNSVQASQIGVRKAKEQ